MNIAESGAGPLVVLCHGFPESWFSWRHQLHALAEAGFHAIAPDMRGYGQTDRPEQIDRHTLLHHVGDVVGLLDALGIETAVTGGEDGTRTRGLLLDWYRFWSPSQMIQIHCAKTVPEFNVFNPFELPLSEKQIPRFVGNVSS
jgi:hypothetical protein